MNQIPQDVVLGAGQLSLTLELLSVVGKWFLAEVLCIEGRSQDRR